MKRASPSGTVNVTRLLGSVSCVLPGPMKWGPVWRSLGLEPTPEALWVADYPWLIFPAQPRESCLKTMKLERHMSYSWSLTVFLTYPLHTDLIIHSLLPTRMQAAWRQKCNGSWSLGHQVLVWFLSQSPTPQINCEVSKWIWRTDAFILPRLAHYSCLDCLVPPRCHAQTDTKKDRITVFKLERPMKLAP